MFLLFFLLITSFLYAKVDLGIDRFFLEGQYKQLKGKRVGLLCNHTSINSSFHTLLDLCLAYDKEIEVTALFCPEHGLEGRRYAWEEEKETKGPKGIPLYSLDGTSRRRPTKEMLEKIDVIIYDIQSIGARSYTYEATLFYCMEEAAKYGIKVIVLDRPNPIGGEIVDGPMLSPGWRSFIGYIDVPYCHGMTIGELAIFFNREYKVGCDLEVVPMKGWSRKMQYKDTGLSWIPTSPYIPEPDTPLFYPVTGILGELGIVNIGIGYTMPFKVIGAPWIDGKKLGKKLKEQKIAGVHFTPFFYRPFYGLYKGVDCEGVLIKITDEQVYRPLSVQYAILSSLKALYNPELIRALNELPDEKKDLFCKATGSDYTLKILCDSGEAGKNIFWKLVGWDRDKRKKFILKREEVLLY